MEEELSEHDLEDRMYAMLHYVDDTQANDTVKLNEDEAAKLVANAPRSTVRRYWRTSCGDINPMVKVNTPYSSSFSLKKDDSSNKTSVDTKPKEEKSETTPANVDLSLLQSPTVPKNLEKTIEVIEDEENINCVYLETSDEDEVIEVALPPKPTITIESSDDEDLTKAKNQTKNKDDKTENEKLCKLFPREGTGSPVSSVVSSVSDEFILSDCIALKISSKHPEKHSFDFSQHGVDLIVHSTPSKKKKKKSKDKNIVASTNTSTLLKTNADECFATPKSKAKNKSDKTKSYTVSNISFPNPDVYDSDSQQSVTESIASKNSYVVTESSLPCVDVYESDSNNEEIEKIISKNQINKTSVQSSNSSGLSDNTTKLANISEILLENNINIVDLTEDAVIISEEADIQENIVMGNVTGFIESDDYGESDHSDGKNTKCRFGSTKVPAILFENLDFDNFKGKDSVSQRRKYSLTSLRSEMEKFYNESWGGEDFNHREIQKNMSKDKNLWVIDPKDRMSPSIRRKVVCHYCNRVGHRDDTCRLKPPVCYMCGDSGHYEARCPRKICVNCGSPNFMYSNMCRNCSVWGRITCSECGQRGHPQTHCPDLWRRYHNTIDETTPLVENHTLKRHYQLFCSGCSRRGHLVHTCRLSLPFSDHPINSCSVASYRPLYFSDPPNSQSRNQQQNSADLLQKTPTKNDGNKRLSKSPARNEDHQPKKRTLSIRSENEDFSITNTSQKKNQKKTTQSNQKNLEVFNKSQTTAENAKTPNCEDIVSANIDKQGQMIQDNEVSDTSAAVTNAKIYVTQEIIKKLNTNEGGEWLKTNQGSHDVEVQFADDSLFLSVKGKEENQDSFVDDLKNWSKDKSSDRKSKSDEECTSERDENHLENNMPKSRLFLIQMIQDALKSLDHDLGDPQAMHKELLYLQKNHQSLLSKNVISAKQVRNSRDNVQRMQKKLNMVLIGQAGLADGRAHLNKLNMIQIRLRNIKDRKIDTELRQQIGSHFHPIFTSIPRDDYTELIKKFYNNKNCKSPKLNKSRNDSNWNKESSYSKPVALNENEMQKQGITKGGKKGKDASFATKKLRFCLDRVSQARPKDMVLKKTKSELLSRLRAQIYIVEKNANTSPKDFKKLRKIQKQTMVFLTNV